MHQSLVGVIGGTGLYQMEGLEDKVEIVVDTPFGPPSDKIMMGVLEGVKVAFLARHGKDHRFTPTEVPYRANIYAMKKLGVKYIISVSAVGSLKEEHAPLDIVLSNQYIDRTKHRISTFFGDGLIAHVAMGDPTSPKLSSIIFDAAKSLELPVKITPGGTYVALEGPAFSTRAESNMYRQWGADVVGMTAITEAKLAREVEIAFSNICMVTDYDCWHPDHGSVTVEIVSKNLVQNVENAKKIIRATLKLLQANQFTCDSHSALKSAIVSQLDKVPKETIFKLHEIIKPYLHTT